MAFITHNEDGLPIFNGVAAKKPLLRMILDENNGHLDERRLLELGNLRMKDYPPHQRQEIKMRDVYNITRKTPEESQVRPDNATQACKEVLIELRSKGEGEPSKQRVMEIARRRWGHPVHKSSYYRAVNILKGKTEHQSSAAQATKQPTMMMFTSAELVAARGYLSQMGGEMARAVELLKALGE